MTDTLPLWLWLPAAIALWGFLAIDALVRARNRRSGLARALPTAMSLEGSEYGRSEHQERQQAHDQHAQQPDRYPQHQQRRNRVHSTESSAA